MGNISKETPMLIDYFEKQKESELKYGEYTILFYQVGDFYQIYNDDEKKIGKLHEVRKILNLNLASKNRFPMIGFPISAFEKNVQLLIEHNWTIVEVKQEENNPSNRRINKVYSIGTYVNEHNDIHNYFAFVYAEGMKSKITKLETVKYKESFGIVLIDNSTGDVLMKYIESKKNSCDILVQIFQIYKPSQTILRYNKDIHNVQTIQNCMNNTKLIVHKHERKFEDTSYQEHVIFKTLKNENSIENLGIEFYKELCISLTYAYSYFHENFISTETLKTPVFMKKDTMCLHNNAVPQLNLLNGKKSFSLFEILDFTKTALGKRKLENELTNPYIDVCKIIQIHNKIDFIKTKKTQYIDNLRGIIDLEKAIQNIGQNNYHCENISCFIHSLKQCKCLFELDPKTNENVKLCELINYMDSIFNFDNELTPFVQGYNNEIDKYLKDLKNKENQFQIYFTQIQSYVNDVTIKQYKVKEEPKTNRIIINKTIAKGLESHKSFKNSFKIINDVKQTWIDTKDNKLCNYNEEKTNLETDLRILIKKEYSKVLSYIYENYNEVLDNVCEELAFIDTCVSKMCSMEKYKYCIPEIVNENSGWFNIREIRHPIIERLSIDTEYVTNDCELNDEKSGILLFGPNGVGKSSFGKAIALSIIMAQSGHGVPCQFMRLSIFEHIHIRMTCDDNLFKGQSSFVVEMKDLDCIVNNCNNKTLVIGDEICKGTEHTSAQVINVQTIKYLCNKDVKFIISTHLHDLMKVAEIKNNSRIKALHLSIKKQKNGTMNDIVYKRKLQEGAGQVGYGIVVAKSLISNDEFFEGCEKIEAFVMNKKSILSSRKNNYNNEIVDCCEICKSQTDLDTHHIIFQCNGGTNEKSNLVTLCKIHHDMVHSNPAKLIIKGWVSTLKGTQLEYEMF